MPNSLELAFPTSKEESHGNETDNRVEHHVIQVPLSSLKLMGRGQLLEVRKPCLYLDLRSEGRSRLSRDNLVA